MTDRKQQEQRMAELARKWQEGTLTDAEKLEFDQWFDSFDDAAISPEATAGRKERIYAQVVEGTGLRRSPVRVMWRKRFLGAAAVLLLVAGGWWYTIRSSRPAAVPVVAVGKPGAGKDIVPGGNKAILTLGNGSQVILDSVKDGLLAKQGATQVVKKESGVLIYEKPGAGDVAAGSLYNTITTPRGGQYAVTLSDGSKVWLNASSSIRFPTVFSGSSRAVEIKGEAYFEIAANKSMPFKVEVDKMAIEVLGTEFNIMAYSDEGTIKTTLVNGAIRVAKGNVTQVLRPGQQAQLKEGVLRTLDNADVGAAVAWKNGRTLFADEDITAIMRKISRWYDVDVEYKGAQSGRKFTGAISRKSDIAEMLKILELNQIHFTVEGRKITIL